MKKVLYFCIFSLSLLINNSVKAQNSYCLVKYHICRDINGIIQSHKANCIIIGDIECNDTKIDKPIPNQTTPPAGFNWYQNWETDCFKDVDCML